MSEGAQDRVGLAAEAFIYGYPLVADLEQVIRYATVGAGVLPGAPFNSFGHGRRLAGPDDTFVSINNDTVYSFAQLDLGAGPQLLEIPDVGARYVVYQFVDAWTNNPGHEAIRRGRSVNRHREPRLGAAPAGKSRRARGGRG
jgi:hypothetical protein